MMKPSRRTLLAAAAAWGATQPLWAQNSKPAPRFAPVVGDWRHFELTTRVDVLRPQGATQLWVPVPSVNSDFQQSLETGFSCNGQARMAHDARYGVRLVQAQFASASPAPVLEVVSHVATRNRAADWNQAPSAAADPATLRFWTQPTALIPTDGIVRHTALQATQGAHSDADKVQRLYDWVVRNTYREPKVRGCGEGDIKALLESGNLGGKCADLNALFVGLVRALGIPARDLYGIRLAPSAFGYKELSGNPASLNGAQHCRAEVYLKRAGWVAMDPADVAKVMRQETSQWIKSTDHPVVAPVNQALFGSWEGNWLAYNMGHDLQLPGRTGPKLGFFMYPAGQDDSGPFDSYAPDEFRYTISARELAA